MAGKTLLLLKYTPLDASSLWLGHKNIFCSLNNWWNGAPRTEFKFSDLFLIRIGLYSKVPYFFQNTYFDRCSKSVVFKSDQQMELLTLIWILLSFSRNFILFPWYGLITFWYFDHFNCRWFIHLILFTQWHVKL